jgi:hypothetical protein
MGDHEGMYNGWAPNGHLTQQWIDNAQDFMDEAFRKVKGPKDSKMIWCSCGKCGNLRKRTKQVMAAHLHNFGFTRDYSKWTFQTISSSRCSASPICILQQQMEL